MWPFLLQKFVSTDSILKLEFGETGTSLVENGELMTRISTNVRTVFFGQVVVRPGFVAPAAGTTILV